MAINITEANKSTFTPDFTLNEMPPMDLSSIKASVDSITKDVQLFIDDYKKNQAVAEKTASEVVKPQETKGGLADKILGKVQAPAQKTTADYIKEFADQKNAFQQAMGITDADIQRRTELQAKMKSLNDQLAQKELAEEQSLLNYDAAHAGLVTADFAKGEKELIKRASNLDKAGIAYQISALSGEYNLIQGRMDEADKFFSQAINFATQKERQEVEDYRWALDFYQDIDKEEKAELQKQFDNAIKTEQLAIQKAQFELDKVKEGRLGGETAQTNWTDFQFKTSINTLKQGGATYEDVLQEIDNDPAIINKQRGYDIARELYGIKEKSTAPKTLIQTPSAQAGRTTRNVLGELFVGEGSQQLAGKLIVEPAKAVGNFFAGLFGR